MSVSSVSFGRRCAAVLLTAAAAVVSIAAPAQAALPSGSGWSTAWRYYAATSFEFSATLPGVAVAGYGTDIGGTRAVIATLSDTAKDNRCARVELWGVGPGLLDAETICVGGASVTLGNLSTTFDGALYVNVYRMLPFTDDHDRYTSLYVPSSKDDAGLRTLNTGAKWSYSSGTAFSYEVRRSSVIVSGYGQHTGNERKAWSTVQKSTSSLFGCSSGKTTGSVSGSASGLTCAANGVATFNHAGLDGSIAVQACHTPAVGPKRCLIMSVSEPA
jgi:hypothetical protein